MITYDTVYTISLNCMQQPRFRPGTISLNCMQQHTFRPGTGLVRLMMNTQHGYYIRNKDSIDV